MSNIYITEPGTSGKVVLKTTVGDIDIELWSRETPKTCRNFIQLCLEKYYNGCQFFRLIPDFIVQTGDPSNTGNGGQSVYDKPFKNEIHSRLRFVRRGLVAMASNGTCGNQSQFFFTLAGTPDLQGKHTIFGKVVGDTLYNMLKLGEGEVKNEKPSYTHKIIKTKIIVNPFNDIVARTISAKDSIEESASKNNLKKTSKLKPKKDFKLLSFGDEAEVDEQEANDANSEFHGKSKSSHDLAGDPKLSSEVSIVHVDASAKSDLGSKNQIVSLVKEKLDMYAKSAASRDNTDSVHTSAESADREMLETPASDDNQLFVSEKNQKKRLLAELKAESRSLRREVKAKPMNKSTNLDMKEEVTKSSEAINEYIDLRNHYNDNKTSLMPKDKERELETLNLLKTFQSKLVHRVVKNHDCKSEKNSKVPTSSSLQSSRDSDDDEMMKNDNSWMFHKLDFSDDVQMRSARDANVADSERYSIYDPRNDMNKRRRENNAKEIKRKL